LTVGDTGLSGIGDGRENVAKEGERFVRVELPARRPAADASGAGAGEPSDVPGVALVTIDRPGALNALSSAVIHQVAEACDTLAADPACRVVVFTGAGTRAFAAGADIAEMAGESTVDLVAGGRFDEWDAIARLPIPTIAAVRGYALGGGLELAMSCDMLVLGDDARLGQPEIKIGILPGAGGTQRLTRAVGRARAMELILTGRTFDAAEAERAGLATRVVPAAETLVAALELAATIATMPPLAVRAAKDAIRQAEELPLSAGLRHERQLFYLLFATEDRREGMSAFLDKRPPAWRGR
jgi:enoyl-CoA hydratase